MGNRLASRQARVYMLGEGDGYYDAKGYEEYQDNDYYDYYNEGGYVGNLFIMLEVGERANRQRRRRYYTPRLNNRRHNNRSCYDNYW